MSTKYLLLSIDGGGLRGIVPLQFLKYIEQRTGKRIQDCFHFIAGTSTGGLIACALAVQKNNQPKFKLSDIENIYIENGKDIFPQGNAIGKFFRKLKSIVDPTFSAKGLSQVLKNNFGDDTMLDCSIPILVPAFDLKNNYAVMFKYRHAKKDQALNVSLYNVCRSTSAGPTYLPSHKFQCIDENTGLTIERECIDGGVYINNPGVAAYVEFRKYFKDFYGKPDDMHDENNWFMLSLGTGRYSDSIDKSKTMGQIEWATKISDVMMQGVNMVTTYECAELFKPSNFLRLQIEIDDEKHSDMANSSDATRNYLIQKSIDYLAKDNTKYQIDAFLFNAGLINTPLSPPV